jgi:hypothetical protein
MRKRDAYLHDFLLFVVIALFCNLPRVACADAASLPGIISGLENRVPDCVTPERLMEFVLDRNRALLPPREIDSRFSDVASLYKRLGECVTVRDGRCTGVRWDYAFFQMLVETNYLLFTGGVRPEDNNFAGIGATVAGKPGERFGSVREGILAHLQHLLVYAGVSISNPIAQRTTKTQSLIHQKIMGLGRPVTFEDLAMLWTGTDKNTYASSIQRTVKAYSDEFCAG